MSVVPVILSGRQAFDPRATLFAHNEPGVWYDPSDLGTMFTDSAGTTPVTGVEQAVGLILDKSRGLTIGSELMTNGDFSSGTGWTTGAGWSIGSGVATSANGALLTQGLTSPVGKTYLITVVVASRTSGSVFVSPGGNAYSPAMTAAGTYTFRITATAGSAAFFYIDGGGTFNGTVDSVSVREIAGTHAIQASSASRPVLRARYNRMTYSEAYDNAAFNISSAVTFSGGIATFGAAGYRYQVATVGVVQNVTYTLRAKLSSPTGKAVIGLRMANNTTGADGTYQQVALTATPTVYSITRTFTNAGTAIDCGLDNRSPYGDGVAGDVVVTEWDLRSSNDTYLPYQRIAASTDYDTVGFPVYLAFDGSDDSLYTGGNVDFSATDKMTVWAGVTKLSDGSAGTYGCIAELGTDINSVNGTWALFGPAAAPGGTPDFGMSSRGTLTANAIASSNAAPITRVMTGEGQIGGLPFVTLRLDGTQAASGVNSQGTGNYASAVVNIGRRNNASLPFNGRLYQLIGRGAATAAALIQQADRWVAGKQGRAL